MKESKLKKYLKFLKHLDLDQGWFLSDKKALQKFVKENPVLIKQRSFGSLFFLRNFRFVSAIVVVILILGLGGGVVLASQESLPGDILFPIKLFSEEVEKFLARGDFSKAEVSLKLTDRRLKEVVKLISFDDLEENQEHINKNLERFKMELKEIEGFLLKLDIKGKRDKEILKLVLKFEGNLARHQEILDEIEDVVPDQIKEIIQLAREASAKSEEVSFEIVLKIENKSQENDDEDGDDEDDDDDNDELNQSGTERRVQGKITAASNKINEVERKINKVEEKKGEESANQARTKLEEAKSLLEEARSDSENSDFLTAFRKAQEVIRLAQEAKRVLNKAESDDDKKYPKNDTKIEVKIKHGKAEIKIKLNRNKFEFTFDSTSREEIVAKIAELTGLTPEEIEEIMKFKINEDDITPTPDITAPVISDLSIINTTTTSTMVTWRTNEPADSKVWYDTSTPLVIPDSTPMVSFSDLVLDHEITLFSLTSGTTYYYQVSSIDAVGNATSSTEQAFNTLPE